MTYGVLDEFEFLDQVNEANKDKYTITNDIRQSMALYQQRSSNTPMRPMTNTHNFFSGQNRKRSESGEQQYEDLDRMVTKMQHQDGSDDQEL